MRNILIALFLLIVVFLIAVGGFVFWMYNELTTPSVHSGTDDYITIEKGTSSSAVIELLRQRGIIGSGTAVKIYLRTIGDASKIQAGEYRFPSPITPLEALKLLEKGEDRTVRFVIPEGFTRFDIAKRIAANFPQDPPLTEDQILLLMNDTSLIKDIAPGARNLEGYMYPSTYHFPPETKPEQIIKTTVEQFKKIWKPEWAARAKELGRTPLEIVTIASLIETESPVENERPIVSSVIYNRIEKKIPLGIDQTVVYVAKMQNRWDGTIHKSDIEADSPYNTRKYGGIPPGPIASVSVSSIKAALNPAKTDYIFYVRDVGKNDGSHHFYASAAEFEKGKAAYQRWLEEQRKLKREAEGK